MQLRSERFTQIKFCSGVLGRWWAKWSHSFLEGNCSKSVVSVLIRRVCSFGYISNLCKWGATCANLNVSAGMGSWGIVEDFLPSLALGKNPIESFFRKCMFWPAEIFGNLRLTLTGRNLQPNSFLPCNEKIYCFSAVDLWQCSINFGNQDVYNVKTRISPGVNLWENFNSFW